MSDNFGDLKRIHNDDGAAEWVAAGAAAAPIVERAAKAIKEKVQDRKTAKAKDEQ